jgi:WD40 repeat protein
MYNTAAVFETQTGQDVVRLTQPGPRVDAMAFSPDGKLVATGSADGVARVFEARTSRETVRFAVQGEVRAVAFSPDGNLLATGSEDKTARVFDVRSWRELVRLPLGEPTWTVKFLRGDAPCES